MSKVYIEKSRAINYQNVKAGMERDCKTQGDVDLLEASVDKLVDRMYEKYAKNQPEPSVTKTSQGSNNNRTSASNRTARVTAPVCPECKGDMWDNHAKKRSGEYSPKSPDFACKDKNCNGARWDDGDEGDYGNVPDDLDDIDIDDVPF